jgi:hypothetical protein
MTWVISYLLTAACLFFLLHQAARLPRDRQRVAVKRQLLIVFALLNFYWFDDLWFSCQLKCWPERRWWSGLRFHPAGLRR